jgi:hypothetical protein
MPGDPEAQLDDARAEIERLRDELADSRLEVLRLRDKLIGAEAELGTALGRITHLHAELSAYAGLPELYQQTVGSTTWRLMWKVMTPYRKVRERMAPPQVGSR